MKRKVSAVVLAIVMVLGLCVVPAQDAKASDVIVVLDPGHGGIHCGCVVPGLPYEQEMNLNIAMYCKEELETYEGVTVIMTRTSDTHLATGLKEDLRLRVQKAVDAGAAFLVSIHLNASENRAASGSMAFVSFQPNIHAQSVAMGNLILNQLAALGLTNNGCITTKSPTYFDPNTGAALDYYAINRHGASMNMPSIIIESCFMDNPNSIDRTLCSTEYGRKQLGIANATGIAQYFGLSKKQPETTAPETTVPETIAPETTVPEATAPESTSPETTSPESTSPESTSPETTEPEPTSPEGSPSQPETDAAVSDQVEIDGSRIVIGNRCAEAVGKTLQVKDGRILISGIVPGTTAAQFLDGIQTGGTMNRVLVDRNGTACSSDAAAGTGMELVLTDPETGAELARCLLVIYGDLNQDAIANVFDFSIMKSYLLGRSDLATAEFEAADLNNDESVDILDFSMMKACLLGKYTITQ
ncbi:MAG: N-acetylmuramoyl-L-alanine amidase [Lachnospiraceae bacterium]|nr:N-acetylmuramoyl-L-alanine amidase [Lachnospiraceae bacterium]